MNKQVLYSEFNSQLHECPFCQIRKHLIIAEYPKAFMTIALFPYHEDHILIIPKKHITSFLDLSSEEYEEITSLLKIGMRMTKNIGHENATLFVREGKNSGKTVPHLHYHIVPEVVIHSDIDPAKRIMLSEEQTVTTLRKMKIAFDTEVL